MRSSLKALVEAAELPWYKGVCRHKHELNGSGAIFFQSLGFLKCARCKKYQMIKKPLS